MMPSAAIRAPFLQVLKPKEDIWVLIGGHGIGGDGSSTEELHIWLSFDCRSKYPLGPGGLGDYAVRLCLCLDLQ